MVVMAVVAVLAAFAVGVIGHFPTHKTVTKEPLLDELGFFKSSHAAIKCREVKAFALKFEGELFHGERPVVLKQEAEDGATLLRHLQTCLFEQVLRCVRITAHVSPLSSILL